MPQDMPQQSPGRIDKTRPFRDEMRFIRSWLEKPLVIGAVAPSGKALSRTMARYVDPASTGPVVEIGPGTGPVTEALLERGIDESRLVLLEFNPSFCDMLRERFPRATIVQGDAYDIRNALRPILKEPCAAVISGLPLFTKPLEMRIRLLHDIFTLLAPQAPFIQFTYAVIPPIPKSLPGARVEASERIWMNIPPARVWVYRQVEPASPSS